MGPLPTVTPLAGGQAGQDETPSRPGPRAAPSLTRVCGAPRLPRLPCFRGPRRGDDRSGLGKRHPPCVAHSSWACALGNGELEAQGWLGAQGEC